MTEKSHTELESALKALLALSAGRAFFRHLFREHCAMLTSAMHLEPSAQSYNLGRQAIGLLVLGELMSIDRMAALALLAPENQDDPL
jgi:hypothetical protein